MALDHLTVKVQKRKKLRRDITTPSAGQKNMLPIFDTRRTAAPSKVKDLTALHRLGQQELPIKIINSQI